ncbi:hypothetical protein DSAG12_01579 [Promethearchaeum syntrophicum]|uniref:Uncharacterized protein n=1 Tax=Promethearchaeum syntrophicum TaxID=2594042 RepID=A0A5B9D9H7_9ARCH|nr:hypothetical protein [Candidatus Prometheoarchaeum syntrophicum]QEE15752.1 hypothetical protein DSAG12_01579 [Candidatus Prometheoarchaeum syntrophicum]
MKYYEKSPFLLAKQYCDDPLSLTDEEIERLIWEANASIREMLESNYPPDNEVVKKINDRLSYELKYNLKIIF